MIHSMLRRALPLAGLLLALGLAGCGSKSTENASQGGGTPPATSGSDTSTPKPESAATVAATPSLELGEKVFKQRCVLCHGPGGHGDGPAAAALKPHPRNFHDTAYMKSRTDAELLVTIHNGKGPMPAWKTILTEAEMQSALMVVRQFAKTP